MTPTKAPRASVHFELLAYVAALLSSPVTPSFAIASVPFFAICLAPSTPNVAAPPTAAPPKTDSGAPPF